MKSASITMRSRSRRALLLALIPFWFHVASPHQQAVHQYIAREGYSLLLKANASDVPELTRFIGLVEQGAAGDSAWQMGFVTTGAWREDDEDVVFHYDILPGLNYALTSITHFWSADRGDYTENMIRLQIERPPLPPLSMDIGPYQNAFDKMMKFATGAGWVLNYPRTIICQNTANDHWLSITPVVSTEGFGIPFSYDGIATFYAQRRLTVHSEKPNVCVVFDVNDLKTIDLNTVSEIRVDEEVRNIVVWEILGRMCHLLGDMSVPAHAHLDEHGLNPDSYENYFGGAGGPYRTWNADNAGHPILLDSAGYGALHFLMYTMQQLADHFGSNGPANGNGNDIIGGDLTPAEQDALNTINLGSLGGPTTDAGPWTADQLNIIRDATLPYAIRATAGLLYWFCVKAKIMPVIPPGGIRAGPRVPATASLAQNYPNPFNPSTAIRIELPMAGMVRLSVLDMLGREVALLIDERRGPGSHEVTFDGKNLSSGVYICRLAAGNHTESRKMILLR